LGIGRSRVETVENGLIMRVESVEMDLSETVETNFLWISSIYLFIYLWLYLFVNSEVESKLRFEGFE
jgi:hypothetical protein